jgi:stress-induced morphogen
MQPEEIENKLREQFPNAKIRAMDLTGTGDHWRVTMRAEEFRGLNLVQQHQMVYRALGDWMKKEIHALSLDTDAPA